MCAYRLRPSSPCRGDHITFPPPCIRRTGPGAGLGRDSGPSPPVAQIRDMPRMPCLPCITNFHRRGFVSASEHIPAHYLLSHATPPAPLSAPLIIAVYCKQEPDFNNLSYPCISLRLAPLFCSLCASPLSSAPFPSRQLLGPAHEPQRPLDPERRGVDGGAPPPARGDAGRGISERCCG